MAQSWAHQGPTDPTCGPSLLPLSFNPSVGALALDKQVLRAGQGKYALLFFSFYQYGSFIKAPKSNVWLCSTSEVNSLLEGGFSYVH